MAHVTLTDYEIDHDLLPRVCAQCGEPAPNRVKLAIRIIDGWRGAFQLLVLFFGLFCFPPIVVWVIRRHARTIWVRVPFCHKHRAERKQRVRLLSRKLLPLWTVAVLFLDLFAIVEMMVGGPGSGASRCSWGFSLS